MQFDRLELGVPITLIARPSLKLDVTSDEDVVAAARAAGNVNLLVVLECRLLADFVGKRDSVALLRNSRNDWNSIPTHALQQNGGGSGPRSRRLLRLRPPTRQH